MPNINSYNALVKEFGPTDLSPHAYAEQFGMACPVCRAKDDFLLIESCNQDAERLYHNIKCDICKSTWTDEFALIGYHDLVHGKKFLNDSRLNRSSDYDEPGEVGC
jgi:hypothetical protein